MTDSQKAVEYVRSNSERFLNELKDLVAIPSISTLDENKSDVQRAAEWVAGQLRSIGMDNEDHADRFASRRLWRMDGGGQIGSHRDDLRTL